MGEGVRRGVRRGLHRYGWLGAALLVGIAAPLAVAGLSGNLSIPHNDAWSYSRIAEHFAETGRIRLLGWNRSALLGQVVVLGPLGRSLVAQQVFVAVLGAVLLFCVHEILAPRVGPRRAGVAVAALSFWPGFALLTTSFMADIPTVAAAFLALYLGDLALRRDRAWILGLAVLAGLWACTIRIQGIAAPVAILFVALTQSGAGHRIRRRHVVALAVVFAGLLAAFSLWQSRLPDGDHVALALRPDPLDSVSLNSVRAYFELALVVGPVALLVARPARWRTRGWVAALAVALVGGLAYRQTGARGFFLPNYLSSNGAYTEALAPDRVVFSESHWRLVVVFALICGALLAAELTRPRVRDVPLLTAFGVLTIAGTAVTFAADQQVYGRYLIPLAPWILLRVLTPTAEPETLRPRGLRRFAVTAAPRLTGAVALLAVFGLSSAIAANAWAFDRTRWDVGTAQERRGVPATRIDAGMEWLGWHSPRGVIDRDHAGGSFAGLFSRSPSCVVVSTEAKPNPPAAWRLVGDVPYRRFLVAGEARLFVYETGAAGCGAADKAESGARPPKAEPRSP